MPSVNKKKPETVNPVDEKKEKMKNAFFSGIQGDTKKDSDDSDAEESQKKQEPVNEMNLLDFDAGPATTTASQEPAANSGNLLDDMFGGQSNPAPA